MRCVEPKTLSGLLCEGLKLDKVYVKVWRLKGHEVLVAVCDPELLGKDLSEGKLKLKVSREFYEGELLSLDEAISVIKEATVGNFVGEKAIECAMKAGLVHSEAIIKIAGVPHAQFVLV